MAMLNDAFRILGIEPTTDGRVIRQAYVRLVRIYHPDRFVGMPDDVRLEAERRMKELAHAYETLRSAKRRAAAEAPPTPASRRRKHDPWEDVKRVREEAASRRLEQEQSRRRWLVWEELERQARERAAYEASLVTLDEETAIRLTDADRPPIAPEPEESLLARRLKAARGPDNSLAPRR